MNPLLYEITDIVYNLFFPTRCPYCDKVIYRGDYACADCKPKLRTRSIHRYAIGGYPCVAPFPYCGVYAEAVKNFKFRDYLRYAKPMAIAMTFAINELDISAFDAVTCVPSHKSAKRERGYNQAELLAGECARLLHLPYLETLEKIRNNNKQHTILDYNERVKNVQGVYRVIEKEAIADKRLLIIDDIITTGNTLGECCRVLKQNGCAGICCAAFCSASH